MKFSKRVTEIPPYIFAEIDRARESARAKGMEVISMGIADPDFPPPDWLCDILSEEIRRPGNNRYPDYRGLPEFHKAIVQWMKERFGIDGLDEKSEVITLIGGKEGVAHLLWGLCDVGDVALIPEPAYTVYNTNAIFAGADVYFLPLTRENDFLIDLTKVPEEVARRATVIYVNYPNNPTGVMASMDFYSDLVSFAKRYDIAIASDNPYSEIYYTYDKPLSILQIPGAKDIAIEFNSFSKLFNITGWRIGWACGNSMLIEALLKIKSNIDSGAFNAIQMAMARALSHPERDSWIKVNLERFNRRREIVSSALDRMGIWYKESKATYYFWCAIPEGFEDSVHFAKELLEKTGFVVTPGSAFGTHGEGYFRLSITTSDEEIVKGLSRLESFIKSYGVK